MDNSFKNLIDSASEVLILLPNKPYLDQVAAGLSLYLSLMESGLSDTGKNFTVSCPSEMLVEFSRLIGVNRISKDLGKRNLTIKFVNYQAQDVDKVSYDIDNGQFKLTVTPKPGFQSPTKDQIDVTYTGTGADTIILIGGANESHFPALAQEEFKQATLIHVGTRLLDIKSELQVISFARPASSASEVIAGLIKESGYPIDSDIATNLLAGIEDQSKEFQSPEVTADTFLIFAELLKLGGVRMQKMSAQTNFPKGSIPTQAYNQKVMKTEKLATNPEETEKEVNPEEVPQSWTEPKVYTGTTIN